MEHTYKSKFNYNHSLQYLLHARMNYREIIRKQKRDNYFCAKRFSILSRKEKCLPYSNLSFTNITSFLSEIKKKTAQLSMNELELNELLQSGIISKLFQLLQDKNILCNLLIINKIISIFINLIAQCPSIIINQLVNNGICDLIHYIIDCVDDYEVNNLVIVMIGNMVKAIDEENCIMSHTDIMRIFINKWESLYSKLNMNTKIVFLDIIILIVRQIDSLNPNEEDIVYNHCFNILNQPTENLFFVEKSILLFVFLAKRNIEILSNNSSPFIVSIFGHLLVTSKSYKIQLTVLLAFSDFSNDERNEYSVFLLQNNVIRMFEEFLIKNTECMRNEVLMKELFFTLYNLTIDEDGNNITYLIYSPSFMYLFCKIDFTLLERKAKIEYINCICAFGSTKSFQLFILINKKELICKLIAILEEYEQLNIATGLIEVLVESVYHILSSSNRDELKDISTIYNQSNIKEQIEMIMYSSKCTNPIYLNNLLNLLSLVEEVNNNNREIYSIC